MDKSRVDGEGLGSQGGSHLGCVVRATPHHHFLCLFGNISTSPAARTASLHPHFWSLTSTSSARTSGRSSVTKRCRRVRWPSTAWRGARPCAIGRWKARRRRRRRPRRTSCARSLRRSLPAMRRQAVRVPRRRVRSRRRWSPRRRRPRMGFANCATRSATGIRMRRTRAMNGTIGTILTTTCRRFSRRSNRTCARISAGRASPWESRFWRSVGSRLRAISSAR